MISIDISDQEIDIDLSGRNILSFEFSQNRLEYIPSAFPSPINASKVSGFSESNYYKTPDGTGPDVNAGGFSYWVVVDPSHDESTNSGQLIFGKTKQGNGQIGWNIGANQGCHLPIIGGYGASTIANIAQGFNTSFGEVGKIQVIHCVYQSGFVYLYKNGYVTGPGNAIASIDEFGFPTKGVTIGAFPLNDTTPSRYPYQGGVFTAGICATYALTAQEVRSHYLSILSNVSVAPPNATNLWKASEAGATWTDSIGGLVATKIGTPTVSVVTESFYYPPYDFNAPFGSTTPTLPQLPNVLGSLDIMTVGDSHTIGGHVSYRYICEAGKVAAGMSNLRWVGPVQEQDYFDDAYYAAGGMSAQNYIEDDVPVGIGWVPTVNLYNPDVIVLWLGHNALDVSNEQYMKTDFIQMVTLAHAAKPNIRFLLLSELNYLREGGTSGQSMDGKCKDFNQWLPGAVASLKAQGIVVECCKIDTAIAWDSDNDWFDNAHPSVPSPITDIEGYNKVGQKVWPSLRYICGYN